MIDDRDFSWMGPPAPAPAVPAEHVLWTLTKGVGRAEMRVRVHPLGHELIALVDRGHGLSLLWSQVYKPGDGVDLGAVVDDNKAALADARLSRPIGDSVCLTASPTSHGYRARPIPS